MGLLARFLRLSPKLPLTLHIGEDGRVYTARAAAASGGAVRHSRRGLSRIAWISGAEPLEHPETPRIVASLLREKRFVFLETSGELLRRRIHEFGPVARLYLTLRIPVPCGAAAAGKGVPDAALEAIRGAKLSGFLLCANLIVDSAANFGRVAQVHEQLKEMDVDGTLISPAARESANAALHRRVAEARRQLLTRPWALLSQVLTPSAVATGMRTNRERSQNTLTATDAGGCEEGAQA